MRCREVARAWLLWWWGEGDVNNQKKVVAGRKEWAKEFTTPGIEEIGCQKQAR